MTTKTAHFFPGSPPYSSPKLALVDLPPGEIFHIFGGLYNLYIFHKLYKEGGTQKQSAPYSV